MPSLSLLLSPDTIVDSGSADREAVLEALAQAGARASAVDATKLLEAVHEREKLMSTGFGDGMAMPHVRLAGVKRFTTVLGRSRPGVEFGAIDGKPVRLFLLVVGPEADRDGYKKLLARAANFLKAEGQGLMAAPDLSAAVTAIAQDY
jgi:PTS system nitrogen regulatory IIA component